MGKKQDVEEKVEEKVVVAETPLDILAKLEGKDSVAQLLNEAQELAKKVRTMRDQDPIRYDRFFGPETSGTLAKASEDVSAALKALQVAAQDMKRLLTAFMKSPGVVASSSKGLETYPNARR